MWLGSAEPSGGTGVFGFQLMYPPECDEYTSQVRLRTRPSDAERVTIESESTTSDIKIENTFPSASPILRVRSDG